MGNCVVRSGLGVRAFSVVLATSSIAACAWVAFVLFLFTWFALSASRGNGGDWTYVDHNLNGTRYSLLKQITPRNVSKLANICPCVSARIVPEVVGGNPAVSVIALPKQ